MQHIISSPDSQQHGQSVSSTTGDEKYHDRLEWIMSYHEKSEKFFIHMISYNEFIIKFAKIVLLRAFIQKQNKVTSHHI